MTDTTAAQQIIAEKRQIIANAKKQADAIIQNAMAEAEEIVNSVTGKSVQELEESIRKHQHAKLSSLAKKQDSNIYRDLLYYKGISDVAKAELELSRLRNKIKMQTPRSFGMYYGTEHTTERNSAHITEYFNKLCEDAYSIAIKKGLQEGERAFNDAVDWINSGFPNNKLKKEYVALKQKELHTMYALFEAKQEQKEAEAEERLRVKEEEKARKEYEKEQKEADKAAEKARKEIAKKQADLERATSQSQISRLTTQLEQLKKELENALERKERAVSMAQQTKRGYVYVISNIGSFGENVYKIGMTRRIDPTIRVNELGDASVPFPFDIHAMIYSEDAPALETFLHQSFGEQKINRINYRKEYFKVSLEDIKKKVRERGIDCTFIDEPFAQQYRDSLLL